MTRGIRGGSWTWVGVAALAYGLRALAWALKPEAPVVISESIEPGQTLVITHHRPKLSRKDRKKAAKAETKKAAKAERRAARHQPAPTKPSSRGESKNATRASRR